MTLPDHSTSVFSGNEASFSTGTNINSLSIPIEQVEILAIQQTPSPEISIFDGGSSPIAISSADRLSPVSTATSPSVVVLPMEGSRDSNISGGVINSQVILAHLQHVLDEQNFTINYNSRINNMISNVGNNAVNIGYATQEINVLQQRVTSNSNAIGTLSDRTGNNESTLVTLGNRIDSNSQNITVLYARSTTVSNDVSALDSIVINTRNMVNGLQAQITSNANEISDVDDALMTLGNSSGDYDDRMDAIELNDLSQNSQLDSHTLNIQELYSAIGSGGHMIDKSQTGYATGTADVILDFNWEFRAPTISLQYYGGPVPATGQELIFGHNLLKEYDTGVPEDHKLQFNIVSAIVETAIPTVVALAWEPTAIAADYPVGNVMLTTESPLTTTTNDCIGLRIKGSLGLSNTEAEGVGGTMTMQMCIDTPNGGTDLWEDIAELKSSFNAADGTWVEKTFDIMLAYPQAEHAYKFRGLLSIDFASDDTRSINGAIRIEEVIESGSGTIISEDATIKWDIKE